MMTQFQELLINTKLYILPYTQTHEFVETPVGKAVVLPACLEGSSVMAYVGRAPDPGEVYHPIALVRGILRKDLGDGRVVVTIPEDSGTRNNVLEIVRSKGYKEVRWF